MSTPATATLNEVMAAIADQLLAQLGPAVDGVQVEPRMLFNPTPPCLDIYPGDPFLLQTAMGVASREAMFVVRARVSTADSEGGQELLLDLLDPRAPTSVLAALDVDRTFAGAVQDSAVADGPSGYILYTDAGGGGSLLGCEWRVRVIL
jgi:hypothetical protein